MGGKYVSARAFGYDEADFMSAARRGFVANYLDEGVIDIATFGEKGIALGFKAEQGTPLSALIREAATSVSSATTTARCTSTGSS